MKKALFARLALLSAAAASGSAMAAVPAEVTTAVEAMATDGAVIAGAVLVAIIGIAAIKFIRKAI